MQVMATLKSDIIEFSKEIRYLPEEDLIQAIKVSLKKQKNPVTKVADVWSGYLLNRYEKIPAFMKKFKEICKDLQEDIQIAQNFFTRIIQNLYRDWAKQKNVDANSKQY